jgi:N-methylhydantoinase B
VGFFCVLMHWIDIGGMMVGSCSSTVATEIFQEGLHMRTVRVIEQGRRNEELFRVIQCNTRFPEMLMGDIDAQIGGCVMGQQLVSELALKFGVPSFRAAISQMWDHSEAMVLAALAQATPGEYEAYSFLDNDGIDLNSIVPVGVKVRVDAKKIVVDFSGVAEQRAGPFNAGRNGGAVAAARIALKYLFTPGQPVNEGDFRPLEIEIPDGKFISAVGTGALGSSGNMIPTVVDTVLHALAEAFPDRAAAAHHGTYGVHAFHGRDPQTGRHFYNLDTICGGWGATVDMDGYGPSRSNAHGDTGNVPVEMQEMVCPYRFDAYAMRTDSGGPGRQRGGLGVVKTYRIMGSCRVNLKIDRTKCPPWGLRGGGTGQPSEIEIRRANGTVERPLKGDYALEAGDFVIVRTAGGGGYGLAIDRDVAQVALDVAQGYVSQEAARLSYGVVLDEHAQADLAATAQLRAQMRSLAPVSA